MNPLTSLISAFTTFLVRIRALTWTAFRRDAEPELPSRARRSSRAGAEAHPPRSRRAPEPEAPPPAPPSPPAAPEPEPTAAEPPPEPGATGADRASPPGQPAPSEPESAGAEPEPEPAAVPAPAPPPRSGERGLEHRSREIESPPAGEEAPAPTEPTVIRRTPHLDAPEKLPLTDGAEITVEVYANTEARGALEQGDDIVVKAPDAMPVELGVLLTTSEHLAVVSSEFRRVQLSAEEKTTKHVRFKLRVMKPFSPEAGETIAIQASFLYRGRPCGRVVRRWTAVDGASVAEPLPLADEEDAQLHVHATSARPDLSVIVTAPVNDGLHFVCAVTTTLIPGYAEPLTEPWALPSQAAEFVAGKLASFTAAETTPAARLRALKAAGYEFYDAAPALFKRVLWELIKSGKPPRSIYIASEEPALPWELMIPTQSTPAGVEERDPLGVEFAIGRWVRGQPVAPEQQLPVTNSFVIAPTYAGDRALDASQEVRFLTDRLSGEQVQPASIDDLDAHFASNHASIIHFVCHGATAADDDAIYLDSDEELKSSILRALDGFKALCRKTQPLVFLNSCETGRLVRSLFGGAGFPRSFGDIGARAVIAPLWPVEDTLAHQVAVEVYQRALDEPDLTLAEIIRDVRAKGYRSHPFEDTWAAYCFYGDPLTRLTVAATRAVTDPDH
jgi:CHAT domain